MPPAAPDFWARRGALPRALLPFAWGWAAAGGARAALIRPRRVRVPVVCVGNLVAGGAGKTPVTLALARWLEARGRRPFCLARGYRGRLAGPLAVDPAAHGFRDVGDEALLLAAAAPTIVARDRVAGAEAAAAAGARVIVMDDGFQNPALAKDLSLLVVDGGYGFGNGYVLPAGPLREPIAAGLARADAAVVIGPDEAGVAPLLGDLPVLHADFVARDADDLAGAAVIAFAGIARPAKFFATLEALGARIVARHAFPDHHGFTEAELTRLATEAAARGARLVTTAKDAVRLSADWRGRVRVVAADLAWHDPAQLAALLRPVIDG
jgi:tetraacyldisaccharide 4'-kinase